MIDRYTKAVLTVIAVSLAGICLENAATQAHAQGMGCGSSSTPCYVTNFGAIPLTIKVAP